MKHQQFVEEEKSVLYDDDATDKRKSKAILRIARVVADEQSQYEVVYEPNNLSVDTELLTGHVVDRLSIFHNSGKVEFAVFVVDTPTGEAALTYIKEHSTFTDKSSIRSIESAKQLATEWFHERGTEVTYDSRGWFVDD